MDKLIAELPRTGDNFLECFIKCLRESVVEQPGTSHLEIADAFEEDLKHQNTPGMILATLLLVVHYSNVYIRINSLCI